MRHRWTRTLALPLVAAALSAAVHPAAAAPESPARPGPVPVQNDPQPNAPAQTPAALSAIGDAGSALALMRVLPGSVQKDSIVPGLADRIPAKAALQAGFGLTSSQASSDAALSYERSVAQSGFGGATADGSPRQPGTLVQTALPDNPSASTGALKSQRSPLDEVVRIGTMSGSAHARWSATKGPCVDTIARSEVTSDGLALGTMVPTLPDVPFGDLRLPKGRVHAKRLQPKGTLGTLGGLLGGTGTTVQDGGALVRVPGEFSSTSTMTLVDLPKSKNRGVRANSTVNARALELFGGPLALDAKVRRGPELTTTSTGAERSSKVTYRKPVIEIGRGPLHLRLDDRTATADIPIGMATKAFEALPESKGLAASLIVGDLAATAKGKTKRLTDAQRKRVFDLFVLRLSIGGLDQRAAAMKEPFEGHQIGASARLIDVQLLPTKALISALGPRGKSLPSALLQLSLGEQVASAFAPKGGVDCAQSTPPASSKGNGQDGIPGALQSTATSLYTAPVLWAGAGALLAGALLLVFAGRRPRRTPSPFPRE